MLLHSLIIGKRSDHKTNQLIENAFYDLDFSFLLQRNDFIIIQIFKVLVQNLKLCGQIIYFFMLKYGRTYEIDMADIIISVIIGAMGSGLRFNPITMVFKHKAV